MSDEIRIVVFVGGGLVQGVVTDHPGVRVAVIDYDTDGADENDIIKLHDGDEALGTIRRVGHDPDEVRNFFADIPE